MRLQCMSVTKMLFSYFSVIILFCCECCVAIYCFDINGITSFC